MRRSNGFILGGLLILLAFLGTGNSSGTVPLYAKIAAGVLLIGYGVLRVIQYRKDSRNK